MGYDGRHKKIATSPDERGVRVFLKSAAVVNACLLACSAAQANDMAPFKLTHMDGYVQVSSMQDGYSTTQSGGNSADISSKNKQSNTRTEVFLMTHSYVLHPNFMSLDVGGGPVLQQMHLDTDGAATGESAMLYNFSARASFLRQKPTNGSVFYEHLNPTVTLAPGQAMNQQTTRQGFNISSVESGNPVPVYVNFLQTRNEGKSPYRSVNDQTEQLNVIATHSMKDLGDIRVQALRAQQTSQTGNPNLPIQLTNSNSDSVDVNTSLRLGDDRQHTLTNLVTQSSQVFNLTSGNTPDRRDFRWLTDLRSRHSEQLNSFTLWSYSTTDQGSFSTINQNLSGGVNYRLNEQLSTNAGLMSERNTASQFRSENAAFDWGVQYQDKSNMGKPSLNYAVRYEQHTQTALASSSNIAGEKLNLSGLGWASLGRMYVVAGSVVVSDSTRSQVFLSGRDYVLTVVGAETRIQRMAGGNILDGQDLLLDYRYDIGGSYGFSQTSHTVGISYSPNTYSSLNLRVLRAAPELQWGAPAYALNQVQSALVGLRVDYPLMGNYNAMVGFNIEGEDRHETILSSRRVSWDGYVQTNDRVVNGNVRLTSRKNRINYGSTLSNVDMDGMGAHYLTRVQGADVSTDLVWERDTGGLEVKRRITGSAKAQWRLRLFSLSFNLTAYREESGQYSRNTQSMSLNLRREL